MVHAATSTAVNQQHDHGPFDIVGDVHGCATELEALLRLLGYRHERGAWRADDRTVVFVGDLVDRGPRNLDALRIGMRMVEGGTARCVVGNHEYRFQQYLEGYPVHLSFGLEDTVAEFEVQPPELRHEIHEFLRAMPSHVVLDGGALVVAHTGLPEAVHGLESEDIRHLAAWGVLGGEIDPADPAKRHQWVRDYGGRAAVVYGHTAVRNPVWHRNTIDIDTGCVFGGSLTALRWPERELVSVPAQRSYAARANA